MSISLDKLRQDFAMAKPDEVDRNKAVLIDGQSIIALAGTIRGASLQSRGASDLPYHPSIFEDEAVINLIQNIVIYDHLLVDSQLLLVNDECRELCKSFSNVFRALRVPAKQRMEIAQELDLLTAHGKIPRDGRLRYLKMYLDESTATLTEEIRTSDFELRQYQEVTRELPHLLVTNPANEYEYGIMPSGLEDSDKSLLRAHFYLELARDLELYLSPHPLRASYFRQIVKNAVIAEAASRQTSSARTIPKLDYPEAVLDGFPEWVVYLVEQEMSQAPANRFIQKVDIPPVAKWVFRIAQEKKVDLPTAIFEARESNNAHRFRRWCSEITATWREIRYNPLASMHKAQQISRIEQELKKACSAWQADLDLIVRYEHRQLALGELPFLGKVLTAFGFDKPRIKDPVIFVEKPYLLFLNNLYR